MSGSNTVDWFPPRWLELPPADVLADPDIAELLAHLGAELKRTRRQLGRDEARHLAGCLEAAGQAFTAGAPAALALRFLLLGMTVQRLGQPVRGDALPPLLESAYAEEVRKLPLRQRNARQQAAREAVQALARDLWAQEEHRALRLAEMCELVWARVLDDGGALAGSLPNTRDGLKPWLRPVAPESARRPGAPRA